MRWGRGKLRSNLSVTESSASSADKLTRHPSEIQAGVAKWQTRQP